MVEQTKQSEYFSPSDCVAFQASTSILCDINFVKKKDIKYANVPCVFDIEASSFYEGEEKRCTMYAWVFGINGRCTRGRTWDEFLELINKIVDKYELSDKKRMIVYVHNLSYEFQWFKKYFKWSKVFALDNRKPIYAVTTCGIEFRCSYLLSGYSLAVLGENLAKYKVQKKVGDLDYRLIRHSETPLTDKEWGYILNDGLVVMAHIQEEIERLGNIAKLPLTKTGYVRKLCREKCLQGGDGKEYVKLIRKLTMTPFDYKQLKRTYSGGFTHANINYVNKVVRNVHSFDFSSSYPAVMLSEKYPMSKAMHTKITSEEQLEKYLKTFCCMFDCKFHNIRSVVSFENYLSLSRCKGVVNPIVNNGRVVEADELIASVTEQDFFIIAQMYEWDYIEIVNFKYYYKGYLPKDFILTILQLYKDKTELKGVESKVVEYMVSKGMINSCYGMCVTDVCRDENTYEENWTVTKADIDEMIEAYNKNRQRFLYYPWGVWVTAYARHNLFTGILEFKNDYVYSDTDSIKVINVEKHKQYIENYNKNIAKKIKACLGHYGIDEAMAHPKTIKGIEKPLGVWDYEGMYDRFKTLGAKRYMVENNGKLSITIAGVVKKAGIEYLKHTYGSNDNIFEAFQEDLTFPAEYDCDGEPKNGSGKLLHTYIDSTMQGTVVDYLGNSCNYYEGSGIHLENTEYTMSLDCDFKKLLLGIKGGHMI